MKPLVLTVTLNPSIDRIYQIQDRNKRGCANAYLSAGGKGINVSRALKNLGVKTIATGFLGGQSGRWMQKELTKEGIRCDFLSIQGETRTNLTWVDHRGVLIKRAVAVGPRISRQEAAGFQKTFRSLLNKSSWVVFSGRTALGVGKQFFLNLLIQATSLGKQTVIDTSGPALAAALKIRPFLVKPNQEEAQAIVGYPLDSLARFKKAARYFLKSGAQNIIISLGKSGAFASNGSAYFWARAGDLKTCGHGVGCGDALVAGFIAAQMKKMDFCRSLQFAVACGAANTGALQPGDISRKNVSAWIPKVKVERINL